MLAPGREYENNGVRLRQGDVLLERAHFSVTHGIIALGQRIGGSKKATTVHAAIYVGRGMISQSSGKGLTTDPLNEKNRWKVYRHRTRPDIAEFAADFAQNMVLRGPNDRGFGAYNKKRSVKSAFSSHRNEEHSANDVSNFLNNVDRPGTGYARQFFCSNFVVLCYSLASEFLTTHPHYCIDLDFEKTSPGKMAEWFDAHPNVWDRVGEIVG